MRLIRFRDDAGVLRRGQELGDGTAGEVDGLFGAPEPTGRTFPVGELLAPVEPPNVFCIGLNYREHARETGAQLPEDPVVFMKPTTAVCGPGAVIRIPASCTHGPEVDYEGELAVLIGKPARDVEEADAFEYVLGYTIANDVSARKWQRRNGGQWIRGKGFDSFCPLGPAIVTRDELPDPQALLLRTTLNGEVVQESSTADMIFSVAMLVSFLSRDTTLLPGTVILTGTPPGVGVARRPPLFLSPGDEVVVSIPGIGELRNPVVESIHSSRR
jgi:2-keto-4-pentenoate hydratase/2-oxohepta-3-ene-1,7-dioic acid hydratase in catechol pathway